LKSQNSVAPLTGCGEDSAPSLIYLFQERKQKLSILQTSEEMMNIESKISEIKRIAVSVRNIRLHQAHAAGIQFLFQGLLIGH
jgi:hypothetical protein